MSSQIFKHACSGRTCSSIWQRRAVRDAKKESAYSASECPVAPTPISRASLPTSPEPRLSESLTLGRHVCVSPGHSARLVRLRPLPDSSSPLPEEGTTSPQPDVAPHHGLQVVETLRPITATTPSGAAKVPGKTWLVLEPSSGYSSKKAACLAGSLGGGTVSARLTVHLRRVAPRHVTPEAARENLERATRGTSRLAARHAHLVMGFLAASTSEELGEAREVGVPLLPPVSATEEKAQDLRLAPKAAVTASRMSEWQQAMEKQEVYLRPPSPPGSLLQKASLEKGSMALHEFLTYANRRYGNSIRAWFMLDPEENMKIGQKSFLRRCKEMGFTGNSNALWHFIDSDATGSVSILELDPPSAMIVADFKKILRFNFGDSCERAFKTLDDNRSGRLGKAEFVAKIRAVGYKGPAAQMFELLDRTGYGSIILSDILWLDHWRPPPYIFSDPDPEGLAVLKETLRSMYGPSLLKSWRKIFDLDRTMRVSWDEFHNAFVSLCASPLSNRLPRTEREIAAIWKALDRDCSGWIALREFDTPSFEAVSAFKRWADRVHGSVQKAFRALDGSNCKLSEAELKKAGKADDPCVCDFELLFDGLDNCKEWSDDNFLTEPDVKFLDLWDLVWEEWEVSAKKKFL